MKEGIVYVLTNPAMPKLVKIGKTEIVLTQDPLVEEIFDYHYDEITSHLKKYTPTSVLLEIKLLTELVRAIYDNRYSSAELTAQEYFHGFTISKFFGASPSSIFGRKLWVGLPPRHIKAFLRYCKQKIPPLIETAWHKLDMVDPQKRAGEGFQHYNYSGKRNAKSRFVYKRADLSVKS